MENQKALAPVLFVGHGSPMNALADNAYTRTISRWGIDFKPRPKALLVVSAHWMTQGDSQVTAMEQPRTIHDFYGFPEELFAVQYPAPGSPALASRVQQLLGEDLVGLDTSKWGLDHGTWSVMRHIFPQADVPIVQLSIDMTRPAPYHFELGKKLQPLRQEGVWIVGSGNLVHNLKLLSWSEDARPHDWAQEQDQWFKAQILARNAEALVHDYEATEAGRLSVPTPDHYYPFLYTLGAAQGAQGVSLEYEEIQNASVSMLSVRWM